MDSDKDKKVTSDELEKWAFNEIAKTGGNSYIKEGEIENLIEHYAWFCGVKKMKDNWRDKLKTVWKLLDVDKDGRVTYDEFRTLLNNRGIIQFKNLKGLVKLLAAPE